MDTVTAASDQLSSSPEDGTYNPPAEAEAGDDYKSGATNRESQDGESNADPASPQWDLDTDDIRSISSTELREARPNRWRGPASTWRDLTEQDRLTHQAFVSLRNQDLAAHLYTAFRLKRQGQTLGGGDHDTDNDAEDEEDTDFDAVTGARVRGSRWIPPKSWTAWPLRAHLVPHDYELMTAPTPGDPLDVYTIRRTAVSAENGLSQPAAALEELLCATVVRTATDRIRRRQELGQIDSENNAPPEQSREEQPPPATPSDHSESDELQSTGPPSAQLHSSPLLHSSPPAPSIDNNTYTPTAATDDDRSHALLRPVARRILESLDATLLRLHDARIRVTADLSGPSGTSSSEQGDESGPGSSSPFSRRSRRGRLQSGRSPAPPKHKESEKSGQGNKRRVGRPRNVYIPLDGETESEMLIRVARQRHERIPGISEDEGLVSGKKSAKERAVDADTRPKSRRAKGKVIIKLVGETERQYQTRVAKEKHLKLPEPLADDEDAPQDAAPAPEPWVGKYESAGEMEIDQEQSARETEARKIRQKQQTMRRWPLRDWSDVVGAAALAGFSPGVVARATQRCANLFGQSMEMHTITEVPAARRQKRKRTGVVTKTYQPGGVLSESSLTSGADDGVSGTDGRDSGGEDNNNTSTSQVRMRRLRSMSREPALRIDAAMVSSSDEEADDAALARPQSRRASSVTASDKSLLCPHPACTRFTNPFSRRVNLNRHLKLVHGEVDPGGRSRSRSRSHGAGGHRYGQDGDDEGDDDEDEEQQDSADEMDGAVRVDGFLRPIKIRKGWRAENVAKTGEWPELGSSGRKGRRRTRGDDDGDEA